MISEFQKCDHQHKTLTTSLNSSETKHVEEDFQYIDLRW